MELWLFKPFMNIHINIQEGTIPRCRSCHSEPNVGCLDQHTDFPHCVGVGGDNRTHAAYWTRRCNDCISKQQTSSMISFCFTTWTSCLAPQVWTTKKRNNSKNSSAGHRNTSRVSHRVKQNENMAWLLAKHAMFVSKWLESVWKFQRQIQIFLFNRARRRDKTH